MQKCCEVVSDMGQYDRTLKLLVDTNPEAMARFVLSEWQKHEQTVLPDVPFTSVTQLSGEFQSEELDGDNVLLVEGPEGPLYLVEIEFQSTLHPYMPLRSLEYCVRAKKKHWKAYGNLPIVAAVIYLFDEENTLTPPMSWPAPNGQTAMVFSYLSIQLKTLPREELRALQEPELWPLILLTEGQVDRIMVGDMFSELLDRQLYRTLPIGYVVASWLLRDDDLSWLRKEYQKMFELFKDAPAIQWIEEDARLDERKQAEQRMLDERKQAEQRMLDERKQAEQRVLDERKKTLDERKKILMMNRQTVVQLVAQRFPTLVRQAKAQVRTLIQPELFQQLILRVSLARDAEEAQDALFSLQEQEDDEYTQEANG
jgi:hypothetical protein